MLKSLIFFFSLFTLPLMSSEMTLSMIKPDAVQANHIGEIISRFEANQLKIAALKMIQLNEEQAKQFYQEHQDRPFYPSLIEFMTQGPVVVMVLKGDNAVAKNREIMGATNPEKANLGTLRKDFATSMTKNAVHGSDSQSSAKREIDFFFSPHEIVK